MSLTDSGSLRQPQAALRELVERREELPVAFDAEEAEIAAGRPRRGAVRAAAVFLAAGAALRVLEETVVRAERVAMFWALLFDKAKRSAMAVPASRCRGYLIPTTCAIHAKALSPRSERTYSPVPSPR